MNLALDGGVIGTGIGAILLYAVLGVLLMLLGFYAVDLTTPGPLNRQVKEGKPNAVIITAAGMVGIAFIVVVSIYGSSGALLDGLLTTLIFGVIGVVAQVLGARLLEWVTGIDMRAVLAGETTMPQAYLVAAVHVALGLVVAVAII
ncbi:MAG: hypothetical protein QOF00_3052 [Pseudonocardiales bacterium]|nr:hypothetical protein [Pseudonocardiales bacterium]